MATPSDTAVRGKKRPLDRAVAVVGILCALAGIAVVVTVLASRGYSLAIRPNTVSPEIGKIAFHTSLVTTLFHMFSYMLWLILDLVRTKRALPAQPITMPIIWAIVSCIPGLHIIGGWMVFARNAANTAPSLHVERRWRILRWAWLVCVIAASLWLVVTTINPISAFSAYWPWAFVALFVPGAISCASLLIWKFSTHAIVGNHRTRTSDVFA